eukprot:7338324-Prymnesium_polylepis.1
MVPPIRVGGAVIVLHSEATFAKVDLAYRASKCGAWDIATRRKLANHLVICWVRRSVWMGQAHLAITFGECMASGASIIPAEEMTLGGVIGLDMIVHGHEAWGNAHLGPQLDVTALIFRKPHTHLNEGLTQLLLEPP